MKSIDFKEIELQGHRGARGLWPENSIYGFLKTLELGVNVIELDIVVSGDYKILVSHDPFFNPHYCLDPNGKIISSKNAFNIFQMPYEEIKKFDCGSKIHPHFPIQEKLFAAKPLLADVIKTVDKKCLALGIDPIRLNIEIKSEAKWYGNHQPKTTDEYAQLIVKTLEETPFHRYYLQSFDEKILESVYSLAPKIELAYLVQNQELSNFNIDALSFPIIIISPEYQLLSRELVKEFQKQGLKVIPWNVNEKKDMLRLIDWGIDGIITDYPNRWKELIN
jgi:glycerophosphoryl diester phosphodiesterase